MAKSTLFWRFGINLIQYRDTLGKTLLSSLYCIFFVEAGGYLVPSKLNLHLGDYLQVFDGSFCRKRSLYCKAQPPSLKF